MNEVVDVAILGAGPAGATVARRLATHGARVTLIAPTAQAPTREGFSSRTRDLLVAEGFESVVAQMRVHVPRSGTWGEGRAVSGGEWLVDRATLGDAWSQDAVRSGARRIESPATRIHRTPSGVTVEAGARSIHARLMVDARGRRGPQQRGPLLLAVGRRFVSRSGNPRTAVHAWSSGWCWLADDGTETYVQLTGRPRVAGTPDGWFLAAAAEIPDLSDVLGAPATGSMAARPAHARLGRPEIDAAVWHVGDAAMALDPLSGQGVYEAVRGASVVAAALRTILENDAPAVAALARRFVAERYTDAWTRCVTAAQGFYAENSARGPFWSVTAAAYGALVPAFSPEALRIEARPVLLDGRVCERNVFVAPASPRGVWQVDGVPLVPLFDYLMCVEPAAGRLQDAAHRFNRPPSAVASALNWLRASGALRSSAGALVSTGG